VVSCVMKCCVIRMFKVEGLYTAFANRFSKIHESRQLS
jgi:hypothetical protein